MRETYCESKRNVDIRGRACAGGLGRTRFTELARNEDSAVSDDVRQLTTILNIVDPMLVEIHCVEGVCRSTFGGIV
eukprot:scaffold360490_cov19-Prasinocladus_malaysianus.AAC.1